MPAGPIRKPTGLLKIELAADHDKLNRPDGRRVQIIRAVPNNAQAKKSAFVAGKQFFSQVVLGTWTCA